MSQKNDEKLWCGYFDVKSSGAFTPDYKEWRCCEERCNKCLWCRIYAYVDAIALDLSHPAITFPKKVGMHESGYFMNPSNILCKCGKTSVVCIDRGLEDVGRSAQACFRVFCRDSIEEIINSSVNLQKFMDNSYKVCQANEILSDAETHLLETSKNECVISRGKGFHEVEEDEDCWFRNTVDCPIGADWECIRDAEG